MLAVFKEIVKIMHEPATVQFGTKNEKELGAQYVLQIIASMISIFSFRERLELSYIWGTETSQSVWATVQVNQHNYLSFRGSACKQLPGAAFHTFPAAESH